VQSGSLELVGVLRVPRADGTEAMLVSAPWQVLPGEPTVPHAPAGPVDNDAGLLALLVLARHCAGACVCACLP
jgi:hypothetical protein